MAKKNARKRYILIAAAAIIATLIAIGNNKDNDSIKVILESPVLGTIEETIPANGKIQPVTEIKISPDVSGEIIKLNFEEGDAVRKGDLILQIKPDLYISARDRAEASLNAIKAQYSQQQAQFILSGLNYNRNKALYEKGTISAADYEKLSAEYEIAKSQLAAAQYNVLSAEASLKEADENLAKTSIYSPMTGIISKLSVEIGERVVGTSQMAGTEMLRIADLNRMEVLVDVNEMDIIRLCAGDTAVIEIDAYPNRKFSGTVTHVANSSKNSGSPLTADQATNFEVKVNIDPQSYSDLLKDGNIPLRPGMSATLSISTIKKNDIITIPLQSVTARKGLLDSLHSTTGTLEKVFVYDSASGTVKVQCIRTGIQDMSRIEVTEGLDTTMQIVTGPYTAISRDLKDGSAVTPAK